MNNFLIGRPSVEGSIERSGDISQNLTASSSFKQVGRSQSIQTVEGQGTGPQPTVELILEKGSVRRIRVTCPCGKCTELECEY